MRSLRIYRGQANLPPPPVPLTETQRLILRTIVRAGECGVTDKEVIAATAVPGNTLRPRRWELIIAGLVYDTGRKRRSDKGRAAAVWAATEAGRREAGLWATTI